MDHIITISRQFGSGGHEIGKRLARRLNIPFYDKNILHLVEENSHYSPEYLQANEEQVPSLLNGPYYSSGHTLFYPQVTSDRVFFTISQVLKDIAQKGPCVIVGRCANHVLQEFAPLNFFVHASQDSKIIRKINQLKESGQETIPYDEMKKQILYMDKQRAKYYEFYTDEKWGKPSNYHLCINTSDIDIDQAVDILYHYIRNYRKKTTEFQT